MAQDASNLFAIAVDVVWPLYPHVETAALHYHQAIQHDMWVWLGFADNCVHARQAKAKAKAWLPEAFPELGAALLGQWPMLQYTE